MLTFEQIAAFFPAAVLLTLAPGPDIVMVVSLGLAQGRQAAVRFAFGCVVGCVSHTLIAAFGVAALMVASPNALGFLKWAGAIYLLYLAIQILRPRQAAAGVSEKHDTDSSGAPARQAAAGGDGNEPACDKPPSRHGFFVRGILANALNPKVVIFFYAFFPQFVRGGQAAAPQIIQLGILFMLQCAVIFSLAGYFAGSLGQRLANDPRIHLFLNRAAACVFIVLAVFLVARPL